MDLKELAILKLKLDAYTTLYKAKSDELKKEMKEKGITEISDGVLKAKLQSSNRRDFDADKVRTVLGEKAKLCITESVDAKKFDLLTKKGDKFLITEEEVKECYTVNPSHSLTWDGLEVFSSLMVRQK